MKFTKDFWLSMLFYIIFPLLIGVVWDFGWLNEVCVVVFILVYPIFLFYLESLYKKNHMDKLYMDQIKKVIFKEINDLGVKEIYIGRGISILFITVLGSLILINTISGKWYTKLFDTSWPSWLKQALVVYFFTFILYNSYRQAWKATKKDW